MQRVSKSKRQASRANISCFHTSQSTTTTIDGFNAAHSPQTSLPDSSSYHPASVDAPKLGSCGTCSPHSHPNHHSLLMAQEYGPYGLHVHALRSHDQRDSDHGDVQGTSVSRSSLARAGNAQTDTSPPTRSSDVSHSHIAKRKSDGLGSRSQVN
jgi:hypothetical protein